ncbi:MAG: hypothetical protein ACI8XC_003276 [Gammaproteobacteria bacterium]|jgi:hypothetical protein
MDTLETYAQSKRTAALTTQRSFSLIVETSAYVFKLVRGRVRSLHLSTSRAVPKLCRSKANQKNYWVGRVRSPGLTRTKSGAIAQFLHLQNECYEAVLES